MVTFYLGLSCFNTTPGEWKESLQERINDQLCTLSLHYFDQFRSKLQLQLQLSITGFEINPSDPIIIRIYNCNQSVINLDMHSTSYNFYSFIYA